MRHLALLTATTLAACAYTAPTPTYTACRTPIPLELRLKRIEGRLDQAYAHAPPLSATEHAEIGRLSACYGGAVLGVGTGCPDEWAAARASGLVERNSIRSAAFSVPEYVAKAAKLPLGGERANSLIVAMQIADDAEDKLRAHLRTLPDADAYRDDPLKLMLVSADIQQALICDAEDQAMGRNVGLPFDPAAPVPEGP
jgi:hypothetical protein